MLNRQIFHWYVQRMIVGDVCSQGRGRTTLMVRWSRTLINTRGMETSGPARSRPASSEKHTAPRRSWPTVMRIISRTRFGLIASGSVGLHSRCGIRGQDH